LSLVGSCQCPKIVGITHVTEEDSIHRGCLIRSFLSYRAQGSF
jgi:hypothetical protein